MEDGVIREMITIFLLIGLSLGILSLIALYITSPTIAMLCFHIFEYILLVKLLGINLLFSSSFVTGNILSVSLQGIRKTRISLISSSVAFCQTSSYQYFFF